MSPSKNGFIIVDYIYGINPFSSFILLPFPSTHYETCHYLKMLANLWCGIGHVGGNLQCQSCPDCHILECVITCNLDFSWQFISTVGIQCTLHVQLKCIYILSILFIWDFIYSAIIHMCLMSVMTPMEFTRAEYSADHSALFWWICAIVAVVDTRRVLRLRETTARGV
jgi:hypothetical protein